MNRRGQHSFTVEVKRSRNPDYASRPGDARRSGKAEGQAAGLDAVRIEFHERANQIEARLGVMTVGAVTHDTTSKGYFWAVYLPGVDQMPKPARDDDAARRAILHKVREWCEAAKVISVRRPS
jgi:hypothetical protein